MKIYRILGCAAIVLATVSCSTKISGGGDTATGFVKFTVESTDEIALVTKGNLSDYTSLPASSDFRLVVKNSDGAPVYEGAVSEWSSTTPLTLGNYSVTATYGEEGVEGFGKPYFVGSAQFAVQGGQSTSVSIPVKLGNSIVKIECSDNFKKYFTDWAFKVTTGTGTIIDFPKDETRAAFIDAYKFSISGNLTSQGGTVKSFSKDYNTLEANTCYTVKFDASNVGGMTVSVTFDDKVETVDLGDVELNN